MSVNVLSDTFFPCVTELTLLRLILASDRNELGAFLFCRPTTKYGFQVDAMPPKLYADVWHMILDYWGCRLNKCSRFSPPQRLTCLTENLLKPIRTNF
jgi:hypothetical protein